MTGHHSAHHSGESIDFIDVVFTTAVTIGLTPEVLHREHITGMLSEPWVQNLLAGHAADLNGDAVTNLGQFFVGLVTLLLSWFGIHKSLQKQKIHYDSLWGMARFMLDVALVLLYGVILIFFRRLPSVLFLVMLVYLVYVIWDVFKLLEYRTSYRDDLHRNHLTWLAERIWMCSGRLPNLDAVNWAAAEREAATRPLSRRVLFGWIAACFRTFARQLVSVVFAISFCALYWCWNDSHVVTAICLAFSLTVLYRIAKEYPKKGIVATALVWLFAGMLRCSCHI